MAVSATRMEVEIFAYHPIRAKDFGKYVHPTLKTVPVDYLATLDITGGNSGGDGFCCKTLDANSTSSAACSASVAARAVPVRLGIMLFC